MMKDLLNICCLKRPHKAQSMVVFMSDKNITSPFFYIVVETFTEQKIFSPILS